MATFSPITFSNIFATQFGEILPISRIFNHRGEEIDFAGRGVSKEFFFFLRSLSNRKKMLREISF